MLPAMPTHEMVWRKMHVPDQQCCSVQPTCVRLMTTMEDLHEQLTGFRAGALSGKGKIPYAVLALMDVMRHYPGQVSPCV